MSTFGGASQNRGEPQGRRRLKSLALSPGAGQARRQLAEIMTVRDWVKRGISLANQLAAYRARLESLNNLRPTSNADRPKLGVTSTVAHDFSQTVSKVLKAWQFPGDCHVSFDDATHDLKIDGKLRRDNGKGVRAITHAAFKVALLLFCRDKKLPHPGFLILDTPLLTYRDPITSRYGELRTRRRRDPANVAERPFLSLSLRQLSLGPIHHSGKHRPTSRYREVGECRSVLRPPRRRPYGLVPNGVNAAIPCVSFFAILAQKTCAPGCGSLTRFVMPGSGGEADFR